MAAPSNDTDSARLDAILERLQRLPAELQRAGGRDPIDQTMLRAMLEEYASALGQLRASVREAERRLSSVASTVVEGQRLVREERKRRKKGTGEPP